MYRHREPDSPDSTPGMGAVSPNRPPQLKRDNCGYRCGWGCEAPSDDEGDGGGSVAASDTTWVNPESEGRSSMGLHGESSDVHDGSSDAGINSMLLERGSEDHRSISHLGRDNSPIADGLAIGSYTPSNHSSAASTHGGIVGIMTPGPGIGRWADGDQSNHVEDLPLEYYFLRSPLRLSPQYEHCRGDPLSHLIVPDRTFLPRSPSGRWDEVLRGNRQSWSSQSGMRWSLE